MIDPPNSAAIAELLVNCRLEDTLQHRGWLSAPAASIIDGSSIGS